MINLEIVTPERKVVDEAVEFVSVPTAKGEIGILADHAPLISTLKPGILSFEANGKTTELVVAGGFIEISRDKVAILADIAESGSEIDIAGAREEQAEVEKVLGEWQGTEDEFEVELEKLQKAQARIELGTSK